MRATFLLSTLLACSGSDAGKDSKDTSPDTGDTATTDTDTDPPDTGPVEDTSASLAGSIASPGGPLADIDLRLCRGTACRNLKSDASGNYLYDQVAVDWFSFEVVPPQNSSYATAFAPLEFHHEEARTVDVVMLPHDTASPLGATVELAMGAGLFLTLGSADLVPPLIGDPPSEAAGVFVPDGQRVPTDGIAGTVLGMWYLEPFNAYATTGIPARFEDTWGLADGTVLEVYVGSYDESAWVSGGTATVNAGDITGASLPLLSTVILVQP